MVDRLEGEKFHPIYLGSLEVESNSAIKDVCKRFGGESNRWNETCVIEDQFGDIFELDSFITKEGELENNLTKAIRHIMEADNYRSSMGSHDSEYYSACGHDDYCGELVSANVEEAKKLIKEVLRKL